MRMPRAAQVALLSAFILVFIVILIISLRTDKFKDISRQEVITARHGVVAADDGRCSTIGKNVLMENGTAVDAAVATALCLGVVSPASSGIGGGAFMLVRLANGTTQAFDMRETAPSMAYESMYKNNRELKKKGALSVAVPGEVAGLYKAWIMYGRLPWKRLVDPAEQFARLGFEISPYLDVQMKDSNESIFQDEGLKSIFTSNERLLQTGDVVRNVKLADTLRAISKSGASALYNGEIGKALIKDLQELKGIIKFKDFENYKVKIRDPIITNVDQSNLNLTLIAMPPPSSGGPAMALILNILAEYGFPMGVSGSLGVHRFIEALKCAFEERMKLGDPQFVDSDMASIVKNMISLEYAKEQKLRISDTEARKNKVKLDILIDHGTSHLSVVDAERNAVSMTTSINSYFGAKILSPSTGIILNNQMDDFSIPIDVPISGPPLSSPAKFIELGKRQLSSLTPNIDLTDGQLKGMDKGISLNSDMNEFSASKDPPPTPANFIKAGKRPLSSMNPTIVLKDGKLKGVLGASGGALIIAATTELFLNHFIKGMEPFNSILAPRVYHQLFPNEVKYENWTTVTGDHIKVDEETIADLQIKGHDLKEITKGGAVCQFIVPIKDCHEERLVAVSDPRKGGFPDGF